MEGLSDRVAALCYEKFARLGKAGKPLEKEWTLLAGIVAESDSWLELVSLATGTKCIGAKLMQSDGTIVNDSHAEVLARRGFLRYLYSEIRKAKGSGESRVLEVSEGGKYQVKAGIKWHMFSSRVPCGDASIIPMEEEEEVAGRRKRQKLDVHRTGGKPLGRDDPKGPGMEYHRKGEVRIKPGRGDPTTSLSCSDKISRWLYTGIQGALLSQLIHGSIKLSSIIIGGGGPFEKNVILDSLAKRGKVHTELPRILQSRLVFRYSQERVEEGKPAPASIIWCNLNEKAVEVAVGGRRQGSTKQEPMKGMLNVCKRQLLHTFLTLSPDHFRSLTYRQIKDLATSYQASSQQFKKNMGCWSKKPLGLENFSLSIL